MTTTTHTLEVPGAVLTYDVHGPLPTADGRPPLLLVGSPMDASGFASLVALLPDRTLVTYDPRGMGRSVVTDGDPRLSAETNADDVHRVVEALDAGPVEVFGSSGGAITGLALVARHPEEVRVLVAHEPPLLAVLPDADLALAASRQVQETYAAQGGGWAMARFIALTSWQGEITEDHLAQPAPDPAAFGLPAEDDGSRDDPLLSDRSVGVSSHEPDVAAIRAAPTRVVVAAGEESAGTLTWRTAAALAERLGQELVVFPSHHGGFMGGEHGWPGQPEAFAARLREVLGS